MLKPKNDFSKVVRAKAKAFIETFEKAVVARLSYLGEQCVNHARTLDTYKDQTGNLRSSIGYVIVRNGEIIKKSFDEVVKGAKGKSGGEGPSEGLDLALKLVEDMGPGWALIVVAGMNYAARVESMGLDVLTSAEQLAQSELPGILKDLSKQVKKAKR